MIWKWLGRWVNGNKGILVIGIFSIWITSVFYIWFWWCIVLLHNITIGGKWRKRTWDLCFPACKSICIYPLSIYIYIFLNIKIFDPKKLKKTNNLGGRRLHGRCYIISFVGLTLKYILIIVSLQILSTLSPLFLVICQLVIANGGIFFP